MGASPYMPLSKGDTPLASPAKRDFTPLKLPKTVGRQFLSAGSSHLYERADSEPITRESKRGTAPLSIFFPSGERDTGDGDTTT